jgi:UDP-N-acetylglucosamine 2-epimerase (non-hydrolysing)
MNPTNHRHLRNPKLLLVVGARPNFMKIAPLIQAIDRHNKRPGNKDNQHIECVLVHTGQHYDYKMSKVFFENLEIPEPDVYLGVGSGYHGEQTGKIMIEFEKTLLKDRPDLVIVVGDVNSTMACALTAAKLRIPVAHVEAGFRSSDRTMPEEINRMVTDILSDYLFTTCREANENLIREGVSEDKIFLVGDVMVDTLLASRKKARQTYILRKLNLAPDNEEEITDYCLLTLHRPSNVDNHDALLRILEALEKISEQIPVIFPVHPRTKRQIDAAGFKRFLKQSPHDRPYPLPPAIYGIDPLSYLDFVNLMMHAKFVLTDSGSIQEETTVLDIPCLTLRNTTERPHTILQGTNTLVWNETCKIIREAQRILEGHGKKASLKEWDGAAAERIVSVLADKFLDGII